MRRLLMVALLLAAPAANASDRRFTVRIEPVVPTVAGIREATPYRPARGRIMHQPSAGIYALPGAGAGPNGCEDVGGGFRVASGNDRGCFGGP